MNLTSHAKKRIQQRAIPANVVDLLFQYGAKSYDHHHAVVYAFDRRAERNVKQYLGDSVGNFFIANYGKCYLVADAQTSDVITVGFNQSKKLH